MSALLAAGSGALLVCAAWETFGALLRLPLLDLLGRVVGPARRAGREGRPAVDAELRSLQAVAVTTLGLAGLLVLGPAAGVVLAAAAPLGAVWVLRMRRSRWRRSVEQGLAPTARALADALGAGYPLPQAIRAAAGDGAVTGSARTLLAETSARLTLGEPLPVALDRLALRAGSARWEALTAAILVQRETGGDLVRLLRDLAQDTEQAGRVDADARGASSQARLTARIVIALPVLACVLSELASPGALASLLSDPLSRLMVVAAAVCQGAALVAVRRIARAEA